MIILKKCLYPLFALFILSFFTGGCSHPQNYNFSNNLVFDPSVIAEYFGTTIEPSDKVNVMLHRCGDENLYTSGISTGPIFTVLLAGSAAALFYIYTKSKRKAKEKS